MDQSDAVKKALNKWAGRLKMELLQWGDEDEQEYSRLYSSPSGSIISVHIKNIGRLGAMGRHLFAYKIHSRGVVVMEGQNSADMAGAIFSGLSEYAR